jgi:hypothetical protein
MADAVADMTPHEVPRGTDFAQRVADYSEHRWLRSLLFKFQQIKF